MLADVSLIYLIAFFVHLITRRCFCGTPDYIFCPLDYTQMYENYNLLHYSRMRTTCLLTVSPSMHCAGGCLFPGGSAPRGVSAPGVSAPGGLLRGCLLWGVCSRGCLVPGGVVSQHALRQTPSCVQNS